MGIGYPLPEILGPALVPGCSKNCLFPGLGQFSPAGPAFSPAGHSWFRPNGFPLTLKLGRKFTRRWIVSQLPGVVPPRTQVTHVKSPGSLSRLLSTAAIDPYCLNGISMVRMKIMKWSVKCRRKLKAVSSQVYHVTHLPLYTGKFDNLTDTPWKINGWNLQMTHFFESTWSKPNLHEDMFQPLTFRGVPFRFYTKHRWNLSPSTTNIPVRAPAVLSVPTLVATPVVPQRDGKKTQKSSDGWCVEECYIIIICTYTSRRTWNPIVNS